MRFWIPQREMGTDSKALAEDSLRDGENNKGNTQEDVGQGPRSGVGPLVSEGVGYCGECEDCVALGWGPETPVSPLTDLLARLYSPYPYGTRKSPYPTFESQLKTITEAIKAAEKLLGGTSERNLPGSYKVYENLGKALEVAMALEFPREVFERGYNKGYERGLNAAATDVKNTRLSQEGILERIEDRRKRLENDTENV